jgi:hypothetical protein
LPNEMCNNFNGLPKVRCRHEVRNKLGLKKVCICLGNVQAYYYDRSMVFTPINMRLLSVQKYD